MGQAVKHAFEKSRDADRVMAIWNDLRWKLKTSAGDYADVNNCILDALIRAKSEILTAEMRDPVVLKLEQMRSRISEFTVEEEGAPEIGGLVFCANCACEIPAGEFRKDVSHELPAFLCAKCAAIPGLE